MDSESLSGHWSGEYYIQQRGNFSFTSTLKFTDKGYLLGSGRESENGSQGLQNLHFDIWGTWDVGRSSVTFRKRYRGQKRSGHYHGRHNVDLSGELTVDSSGLIILKGQYVFRKRICTFSMTKLCGKNREVINNLDSHMLDQSFAANMGKFHTNMKAGGEAFSDIAIVTDSNIIKSHKFLLASQSDYFAALLRKDNPAEVRLPFPGDIVQACITFLYTSQVEGLLTEETVGKILEVATYLQIESLIHICCNYMGQHISGDNCKELLSFAFSINAINLVHLAADFIAIRFESMMAQGQLFDLSIEIFCKILCSPKLMLHSKNGRILPQLEGDFYLLGHIMAFEEHQAKQTSLVEYQQHLNLNPFYIMEALKAYQGDIPKKDAIIAWLDALPKSLAAEMTPNDLTKGKRDFGNTREVWTLCLIGTSTDTRPEHRTAVLWDGQNGVQSIRRVDVYERQWDGHHIVQGFKLTLSDHTKVGFGLGECASSMGVTSLVVPDDQHIVWVQGRSGWYLDQMAFVTNTGQILGPVGGGDGGEYYTQDAIEQEVDLRCVYLDGIKGCVVHTQDGPAICHLSFKIVIACN